ncbi:MAG: ABC transporter permease, partial [Acidobacteriota bacterium]|nr:ABC transporter permease [Acidobacteriota bacterium]
MFNVISQDLRDAFRAVRLNPGFAAVAILSLALGAGANTAIFQLLNAVRFRTLPVAAPHELVELRLQDMTHARGTWMRPNAMTNPLWEQLRDAQDKDAFSGLFAWADEPLDIAPRGETRRVAGLWVSGNLFHVLGVQPALGRLFAGTDDHRGCGLATGVVISHGFWQREFGGDASVIGRQWAAGKAQLEIIGVTPPDFFGLEVGKTFDVAMPICASAAWHGTDARLQAGNLWWLTVMGRLKPGVSATQAHAYVESRARAIFQSTLPANYPTASVQPYLDMKLVTLPAGTGLSRLRDQYSAPLLTLFAVTGLVLLVACTNLAHLMLARTAAQQKEVAVRLALGATRRRLLQQMMTESMLLATVGVLCGLAVARVLSGLFVSLLSGESGRIDLPLSLDVRVFAFAVALILVTWMVFAAVPVLRATAVESSLALGREGRSMT